MGLARQPAGSIRPQVGGSAVRRADCFALLVILHALAATAALAVAIVVVVALLRLVDQPQARVAQKSIRSFTQLITLQRPRRRGR
jgi:hypothetical protein